MNETVEWAKNLAEQLLAEALPQRWAHTQGVARQARLLAGRLGDQADLVEAAAWLHDIGYASAIAVTGFHPLDGAWYLRDVAGADVVLCQLVAHHTGAAVEAEERGMAHEMDAFGLPDGHLLDALTAADLTTSPEGDVVSPTVRVAEIFSRYDKDDPVYRAVTRSQAALIASASRFFEE